MPKLFSWNPFGKRKVSGSVRRQYASRYLDAALLGVLYLPSVPWWRRLLAAIVEWLD